MGPMKRWHVALLVLVLFLMGLAYPAQAVEPDPSEGVKYEVTYGERIGIDAVGKTVYGQIQMFNTFGQLLWTWRVTRYWTYNGTRVVTAPGPTITATKTGLGALWQYDGVIGSSGYWINCSGEHAHSCHYQFRQGKWHAELIGIGIQWKYPWISMKVYHDGRWTKGGGG